MKISKYLQTRYADVISKFKLDVNNIDMDDLLNTIAVCDRSSDMVRGEISHYKDNFNRVAGVLSNIERELLERKKFS